MANIKPLGTRVAVKPQTQEETTASGIVLPDTASKERPKQGEVVAAGKDQQEVKVGDIVIFKEYAPTKIKINQEELYILDGDDILATI
ncbi:MAG: co-chaperone GroES [Candidatus Gracilibacteria bacterium]|jgi:chaperonin GroES|nr:co-chaperone GroES [Candidatus Gracilibacteria bacterium]